MSLGGRVPIRDLTASRLVLEVLRVEHADEMGPLLDDPTLRTYIGGEPSTAAELRTRYEAWVVGGSADGTQVWLNWIVRRRDTEQAVGTVQATVSAQVGRLNADVAWVVGTSHQGQGYAREAAQRMAEWLRQEGVEVLIAYCIPNTRPRWRSPAQSGLPVPSRLSTARSAGCGRRSSPLDSDRLSIYRDRTRYCLERHCYERP